METLKANGKAIASMLVCAAAYLTGILGDTEGIVDISFKEWLGLVVFMGGAYGLTWGIKNKGTVQVKELEQLEDNKYTP